MDSGDEFRVVTSSDMSSSFAPSSDAPASEDEEGGKEESINKGKPSRSLRSGGAAGAAAVVDLTEDPWEGSPPSSEVDQEIPDKAVSDLLKVVSDAGELSVQPPSPSSNDTSRTTSAPITIDSSSSPQAPEPSRKRTRGSGIAPGAMLPSHKRKRRSPRNDTTKNSTSPDTKAEEVAAKLELDKMVDNLDEKPSKKNMLGPSNAPAKRHATRTRKTRLDEFGDDSDAGRLRDKRVAEENYEPLHLYKDSNWVLFDPDASFPWPLSSPPKSLEPFMYYKSGNVRILEYNAVSNSVRLKKTPEVLRGKSVRYEDDGPKLVE